MGINRIEDVKVRMRVTGALYEAFALRAPFRTCGVFTHSPTGQLLDTARLFSAL